MSLIFLTILKTSPPARGSYFLRKNLVENEKSKIALKNEYERKEEKNTFFHLRVIIFESFSIGIKFIDMKNSIVS